MKKILLLFIASLLVLTSCSSNGGGQSSVEEKEYTYVYSEDPATMDYVITDKAQDTDVHADLIDGLTETTSTGKLVGAIAESWESNADATVFTFKLKKDVKWVTNTGEEYANVTADDFVTGVRHGADFGSATSWLLQGVIKGYSEYLTSDKSDAAWEKVGVKAVDDLTLEFTLEVPAPYFVSMTNYAVLYPINRAFLESKGEGCKLGSPNPETCEFGTVALDSILYNGAFIASQMDAKSQITLTKNQSYWDKDNVFLSSIKYIYDDGQDLYSVIKGFEQGTYAAASLSPSWEDYDAYVEKYKDNAYFAIPNSSTFGVNFNFNRRSFNITKYATDEAARQNTHNAILNENFRKALRAAYDVEAYLGVSAPEELAKATVRNIYNFPDAGTSKNGTYFELVNKAYNETTGESVDLSDGQYPWLNKEAALKYIEAAKAEGIQFPVHLDMLVIETSARLTKQGQSMAQSILENTDGQIIVELNMKDQDTVINAAYRLTDPSAADYDISTFTGWGPDYADPKSFADTYNASNGTYLKNLGLGEGDENKDIKDAVGLTKFTELAEAASVIYTDLDARYEAYAKADAYLIEACFYIPTSQQTRGHAVSKVVPFTQVYSSYGASSVKHKGLKLQDEIVLAKDRQAALEAWEKARSEGK